jgi:5-methylcytosine-specific restriction endonuclease McrA
MPWLPTKKHKLPRIYPKKKEGGVSPSEAFSKPPPPSVLRSSGRWTRLSKQVRREQPICSDPFDRHSRSGVLVASAEVHHIQMLVHRPDLAYTRSNLVGLCSQCHSLVDDLNRTGGNTRMLFDKPAGLVN